MDNFYRNYPAQQTHPVEDDILERALESFEGAALKFSAEAISDAAQRENYDDNVRRVKVGVLVEVQAGNVSVKEAAEHCYEMRNKIMAEIRGKTSIQGQTFAERKKAVPPELEQLLDEKAAKIFGSAFGALEEGQKSRIHYEIVESSARPNTVFNTANKVLSLSGKVLIVVTIAYAVYDVVDAQDKDKAFIKQAATIGGSAAGTGMAGLAVSTVCGPGAPFCAVGLMLAAGLASGWGASVLAASYEDEFEEFIRWKIN
jgi:hypothetical protein